MTVTRTSPWQPTDRITVVLCNAAALTMLVAAVLTVDPDHELGRQISTMQLAIGAVAVSGIGNLLFLLAGRRAVTLAKRAVMARVASVTDGSCDA